MWEPLDPGTICVVYDYWGSMKRIFTVAGFILLACGAMLFLVRSIGGANLGILDPKGLVAREELALIRTAVLLMLAIVVPVLALVYFVAWKYRADNTKAHYAPNKRHTLLGELSMWLFPTVIVLALALVTWPATHRLDPYRSLVPSSVEGLTIQVVALQWKWLFIYPEQNIATVNFIEFPHGTPLNFELTAGDAPMNSFWIPELGGQIYAMSGMTTKLHLIADAPGEFSGRAAEINGRGFSGMTFTAKATPRSEFDAWVSRTRASSRILSMNEYHKLAEPSERVPSSTYSAVLSTLYDDIIAQFASPDGAMPHM